jgi:hypothetical protein
MRDQHKKRNVRTHRPPGPPPCIRMRMYSVICVYCTCGYPLLYIISKTERYTCRSIVFVIALRPPRRTRLRTRVSICEPIINLGTRRLAVCGPAPPCLCMPASALLPASPHPSEVFRLSSPCPALMYVLLCSLAAHQDIHQQRL